MVRTIIRLEGLFVFLASLYFYNTLGGNWLLFGILSSQLLFVELGLIAIAHVGMDRFFGFGLKYPTDFKNTYIQRL